MRGSRSVTVLVLVVLAAALAPVYWMILASITPDTKIGTWPPSLLYTNLPTLEHYRVAFIQNPFGTYMINSAIISVVATFCVVTLGSLAAYAIARMPIRGAGPLMLITLIISTFPPLSALMPLYSIFKDLHWLNSYQALIVPYVAFQLPFSIWILRNYFLGLPRELEESGYVDGASTMRILYRIILPVSVPGMFTAALFTFFGCWTEFIMALTFNSTTSSRTIAVGIGLFGGEYITAYGTMFAAATVCIVPIVLLVVIFNRWIISGLMSGAVKG